MKISIQEEGKDGEATPRQVFLTFKEAAASIGIPSTQIYNIIKRGEPRYKRRSDKKVFFIREEKDGKLCSIDGEDFHSFQEIKDKFEISPTIFLNQIARKKTHFLDSNEITHFIKNLSPEMEKIIDAEKRMEMNKKNLSQNKECQLKQNSYNVLTKKKVSFPKNKGKNLQFNKDLFEISQKSLAFQSKQIVRPSKGNDLSQLRKKKTKKSRGTYPWG